ncbi:type VII secretion target [Mycobacterium sp. LTG2003]
MGVVDAARIDVAALLDAARQYEAAADIVDAAVRTRLSRPAFDGSAAGQAHVAHGDAVRLAVDDLTEPLNEWVRAAREIAAVLRTSADRYIAADGRAASRVG